MKPRILVVDDEMDIVDLLAFNFKNEGWEVMTAFDGEEAIRMAVTTEPDLILLDLMMPKLDGMAVCEILRKNPHTARIPIIILSAWSSEDARVLGLETGANDYVNKPFSPREVVVRARNLVDDNLPNVLPEIRIHDLVLDVTAEKVTINGQPVKVSHREFKILACLTQNIVSQVEKEVASPPQSCVTTCKEDTV
jgi:DNA-binding response OmpR family regulator